MKHIQLIALSIFILFAITLNSQKIYRYNKVSFLSDTNIYLSKDPSNKINGTVIRKEKKSKMSWEVKNGKLHGHVIFYFKNHKTLEAEYQNGQKINLTNYCKLSDQVESQFNYQNDMLLDYKIYYPDGKSKYEGNNDLNGKPKGFHNAYFENGNRKINVRFWENHNLQEKEFYESKTKGKCSVYSGILENPQWMVQKMQWFYKSMFAKDTSTVNSKEKVLKHFENLTLTQNNIQLVEFFNSNGDIIYSENWSTWTNGEFTKVYIDKKVKGKIEKTWKERDDICEISILVSNLSCYDLNDNSISCDE